VALAKHIDLPATKCEMLSWLALLIMQMKLNACGDWLALRLF
jgi:hypothetical protein